MHIKDIPDMVASGNIHEIERAYRALVGYPSEEEIAGASTKSLVAALDRVSMALLSDFEVMPRQTCEAARLRNGATYRDGAGDFKAHHAWWQGHFNAVCGGH
ncbi:hypothetical protein [Methylobacterium soli]|uniref:Uncharacterized protein n=1 Tax=Methylobacterium soli TaxID=553447 RepID=A0A6L3SSU7_9HYPH|nr:hypothetical protein [Methylobacterium soli]KAB1074107.1 hypothetical protein F6X53_26260 [Methylobacterium soli]GJE44800.1 hypothetical protein AEGHOMDF_3991 [Methylobacterium soli]